MCRIIVQDYRENEILHDITRIIDHAGDNDMITIYRAPLSVSIFWSFA